MSRICGYLLQVELCPRKIYIEVLNSSTCDYDLVCKQTIFKNVIKSSEVILDQGGPSFHDWRPYQKRDIWTQRTGTQGTRPWGGGGRDERDSAISSGTQGLPATVRCQRRNTPCRHLDFCLLASGILRINVCSFRFPSWWYLVVAALGN